MDGSGIGLAPDEATALESLRKQTQSIPIGPEHFEKIPFAATENEHAPP